MQPAFPEITQVPAQTQKFFIAGADQWGRPGTIAAEFFGEPPNFAATSFLYLFRRFGYPVQNWDGEKGLVDYFLSTPDPDIILWCKPASQPQRSFGIGYRKDIDYRLHWMWLQAPENEAEAAEERRHHPIHQRIENAYRVALTELLRPVYVRDMPYTILGHVSCGSVLLDLPEAAVSAQAGYGLELMFRGCNYVK